jgi:SAM-dependent methyltransferase
MALPLLSALPLKSARRVLDVGAGSGALSADLRLAAPEGVVIGVDRSEGMLRVAQQSGNPCLAVTDAQRLGVHSGTIDVVVMVFVLFHLPEPLSGLREAFRVLRDGGTVGIVIWGNDPGFPGMPIWKEELDREGASPDPRDPSVMQHALMNTPDKLEQLLEAAGFVSVRVSSADVAHQWKLDDLLAVQAGCGMPTRRLASLSSEQRAQCLSRVATRLGRLPRAELEYRAQVLFAIASRPDRPTAVHPSR